MTEAEWLACGDPSRMLYFLFGRPGDALRAYCDGEVGRRKLRLFACACVRRIWHLLTDPTCRTAVEVAERYADGQASRAELAAFEDPGGHHPVVQAAQAAYDDAGKALWEAAVAVLHATSVGGDWNAARYGAYYTRQALGLSRGAAAEALEGRDQCRLLRCIFGAPLCPPPPLGPLWLARGGGTVPKLARAIYDQRRFEDLPILADALEEAGCADAGLLGHLRGPGPHARGCWPVDLLLGKA